VAIVYGATLALLPAGGQWIIDNGNKRIQAEALLASGFRDFSLPWPGRELDPELACNPMPNQFSVVRDGKLYSVFSPLFPALAAPTFGALGEPGLALLPLLGALLLLAAVGRIARLAGLRAPGAGLSILIAGLATPLWFYALVFWEHIVAAGLCALSVALALEFLADSKGRKVFGSGVAIALAAGMRDPLLLFAALLGALVFFAAPRGRARAALGFGAGLAAGLLPIALFQQLALGDPLGFHLTHGFAARAGEAMGIAVHLRDRPQVFHHLFLASVDGPLLSALAVAPLALLLFAHPRLAERRWPGVAVAALAWALTGALLFAAGFVTAESPIEQLLATNGFFAAAPILAAGFARRAEAASAEDAVLRRLLLLVTGYALLYALLTPLRNSTGIHWGNRYLLELYGLLAVPCAAGLLALWRLSSRRRIVRALIVALAAASVALQLFSIDLLRRKLVFGERLEQALRARPERVVLTDVWWVPQTLPAEFLRRPILYVSTREALRDVLARLAQRGDGGFLFVTSDLERPPDPRAQVIDDLGLRFFPLRLEHHAVPPRAPAGAGSAP
jgi:hypothetical protein